MNAITSPAGIKFFQMLAQRGAMKLELLGMRHSSGKSIIAAVKKEYGLKGNKTSIVAQFEVIVEDYRAAMDRALSNRSN